MVKSSDENSFVAKYLQDDDLSQECKELIPTLPSEKAWILTHTYQYQGFWIATKKFQGVLSCQKHFQALDSDIILVTAPKSGTTWLKALTFALLNRNKYPIIHNNHPLLISNPHSLVPFLEIDLYSDKDYVPNLNSLSHPRLFSTHIPCALLPKSVKESTCKVRAQSRGPLPLEEAFESFCRGVSSYGPFWEHVLGYWKENLERPEKVMFIKFEEMKMKPSFYLKKIAEFLGCPFFNEEESKGMIDDILNLCSFENLSNLEVNKTVRVATGVENKAFFRRGQVGDWKNLLTAEMIKQLNTITENKLGKHGLSF
ncbi:putative flavonol 3-sulfotransferase [Medicago truncatula]|uniref:Sulfotransferase n=1 Tax=Medicago truncatula TaxID=3880 RepID=A0A396GRY2_MEDTR|nr:putative flavonol 3-sulfotransferase [Medicago truncatula]